MKNEAVSLSAQTHHTAHPTGLEFINAQRPWQHTAPYPILPDEIVVISKHSKLQYDMMQWGLSEAETRAAYRRDGINESKIVESHERQIASLETLRRHIPSRQITLWDSSDETIRSLTESAKLVIAFGGDNHFQRVSHIIERDKPLLGINSDKKTSYGALLGAAAEDFDTVLVHLITARYRFTPWTRLNVSVAGYPTQQATCEIFVGERERFNMSRYTIEIDGEAIEQKSSGLLISTGSGSTGWFKSVAGRYFPEGAPFARDARYARFIATEISDTGRTELPHGLLIEGGTLLIRSLNDSDGVISIDSLEKLPFPRGAQAEITISESPLLVIDPWHKEHLRQKFLPLEL